MTTSHYSKMLNQLKVKPAKYNKFKKHNAPKTRKFGIGVKKCKICGRNRAHISKYSLHLCRQCFRDKAKSIGFKKYS